MTQLYFADAHLEFLEGRDLNLSEIGENLYQRYATNTVKHHKKLEYTPYSESSRFTG